MLVDGMVLIKCASNFNWKFTEKRYYSALTQRTVHVPVTRYYLSERQEFQCLNFGQELLLIKVCLSLTQAISSYSRYYEQMYI